MTPQLLIICWTRKNVCAIIEKEVDMKHCVIITGCTGGLGRAYTFECAKRGWNLVLSATKQDRIENLKTEIEKSFPEIKVYAKASNLADHISRAEFFDWLKSKNIEVDVLINNAGYIFETSFLSCDDNEIMTAVRVNVEGTLDFSQKALKMRNSERRFFLLNVSSMAAFSPMPQMATYAASKSFILNWSIALREELKCKNVFVSCVCPGSMATNDAMKSSIKSQGIGGRLSLQSVEKVAKESVEALLRNKAFHIPGFFNKFMKVTCDFSPRVLQAKVVGKRWRRCEQKRGEFK